MSQLDITISFSQLIGLLIVFYFFIYYIISIVLQYWYNKYLRINEINEVKESLYKEESSVEILKRILKS